MAYFDLEDIKKNFSQTGRVKQIVASLRIAVFVVLAIIIGIIVYSQQREPRIEEEQETPLREGGLTEQQKKKILESLSAPSDAPQYTNEEKKEILKSLSAPQKSTLTEEEKKAILESLSTPN